LGVSCYFQVVSELCLPYLTDHEESCRAGLTIMIHYQLDLYEITFLHSARHKTQDQEELICGSTHAA